MPRSAWPLLLLLILAALPGCRLKRPFNITITPQCADGLPVRMLIDVACPPDGVCGFTCAPRRWELLPPSGGGVAPVADVTPT